MRSHAITLFAFCMIASRTFAATPTTQPAFNLDGYTPPPMIVAQAATFENLVADTKPTLIWDHNLLWISHDPDGKPTFKFAVAYWVCHGANPPYWAILQMQGTRVERDAGGFADNEFREMGQRNLSLFDVKPQHDGGSGNYARVLASDKTTGTIFELGVEKFLGGSGNNVRERRIFVLCRSDHTWQFVGEGPQETQISGGGQCWGQTVEFSPKFTGDPNQPIEIYAVMTRWQSFVTPADTGDVDLTTYRDGVLDGSLPLKFRWNSSPYVTVDQGDTVSLIAKGIVRWESPKKNVEDVIGEIYKLNPGLDATRIKVGTKLIIPSDAK